MSRRLDSIFWRSLSRVRVYANKKYKNWKWRHRSTSESTEASVCTYSRRTNNRTNVAVRRRVAAPTEVKETWPTPLQWHQNRGKIQWWRSATIQTIIIDVFLNPSYGHVNCTHSFRPLPHSCKTGSCGKTVDWRKVCSSWSIETTCERVRRNMVVYYVI